MNLTTSRESNVELLRIVCIFFVLCMHFLVFGLSLGVHQGESSWMNIQWVCMSLCFIAVNCFVLISGYFGIKFKIQGIVNLIITAAICFPIALIVDKNIVEGGDTTLNIRELLTGTFFPISHSSAWFLKCYFGLYLCAPLINKGLKTLSKSQYIFILILLTVANEYLGYFWKTGEFNVNGYTISQFIYLYIIGGYFKRFVNLEDIKTKKWLWLAIYFGSAILYATLSIIGINHYVPHWDGWKYNNPVLIVSAISFLLFFLCFEFKSKAINHLAKSCLAIYLIQNGISYIRIGETINYLVGDNSVLETMLVPIFAFAFMIVVILFDQIRLIVLKPINRICRIADNKLTTLFVE